MLRLHLPHISRLFSANKSAPYILTLCWSVLTAYIIINIRMSLAYGSIIQNVTQTMTQTANGALTQSLADRFDTSGISDIARELRLSKVFLAKPGDSPVKKPNVLGSQIQTVEYWEKILAERPDYRDGYLAAAKSALSENDTKKAMGFITQALQIDPNDKVAIVLSTLLEKNAK
jgi:tetratricopeptide (TPR) repeat protein